MANNSGSSKQDIVEAVSQFVNLNLNNIGLQSQLIATRQTAKYVMRRMSGIRQQNTPRDVLSIGINSISLSGLILEFGVYQGKTINYISSNVTQTVDGFDSFDGLPETWYGSFQKGTFAMEDLPLVNSNVRLHKGWFDESIDRYRKDHVGDKKIAFMHVDCDLYSSTKTVFDKLGDLIGSGTIIVFDEYFNYPGWKDHEYKAFQEFVKSRNLKYEYIAYNNLGEQVAVRIF